MNNKSRKQFHVRIVALALVCAASLFGAVATMSPAAPSANGVFMD